MSQENGSSQSAERWLPVVGFEGIYEVSDHGRVRSLDRRVPHGRHGTVRVAGRLMATVKTDCRAQLNLRKDGSSYLGAVHRMVLEAFVGPCPEGMEGCHNDGNPHNNHVSNLRWDTGSGNTFDAVRHGTHPQARKTHCKYGHEFTPENTGKQFGGGRLCKQCQRDWAKKKYWEVNAVHGDRSPANRTHCPYGHEYTEANTYRTRADYRRCRTCDRIGRPNLRTAASA